MNNKEAIKILLNSQIYLARHCGKTNMYNAVELAIKALENRPQGEWITDERGYVCSECGALHSDDYPFCHMCGADMEGINND